MTAALLDVPGVPETALPPDLLDRLPATTPEPPWHCRVRAVVWVQRGRAPLAGSAYADRATGLSFCALVDYLDSPVGPYREVFAGPLLRHVGRPVAHVPFIAVDSLPSLHGGRAHWALPKTLATFDGDVGGPRTTANGDGWSVAVEPSPLPVPLPLAATLTDLQDGQAARVVLRGRGRAARVRVTASGPTLTGWLGTGAHAGVVGEGRMTVHPPRPER